MPPITTEELAHRLRVAREQAGLTQVQAAEELGVSRSAVTQLEAGSRSVSTIELEILANLYGWEITGFFSEVVDSDEAVLAKLRAAVDSSEEDSVIKAATWCLQVLSELRSLERLLEIDMAGFVAPYYELAAPANKWKAVQQGERVAQEERRRLGLDDSPVSDVSRLLESQGVRTFFLDLPEGVSGLSMMDPQWGFVVGAERLDSKDRRRFSWLHEYGHVVMDRNLKATVTRTADRNALEEVRANSFAATFLMPENGLKRSIQELGKGRPSRERAVVSDLEDNVVSVEKRSRASMQEIALEDIVRIASVFGVSRIAMLYRVLNLGILRQNEFQRLAEESKSHGARIASAMGVPLNEEGQESGHVPADFRSYVVNLSLRAFERGLIARSKLHEIAGLVKAKPEAIEDLIEARGALEPVAVIIPDGFG